MYPLDLVGKVRRPQAAHGTRFLPLLWACLGRKYPDEETIELSLHSPPSSHQEGKLFGEREVSVSLRPRGNSQQLLEQAVVVADSAYRSIGEGPVAR